MEARFSDALPQAATRACGAGNSEKIGTPKFGACMRARGWRFAGRVPEAPSLDFSSSEPSPPVETPSRYSADEAIQRMNQQIATDAANAAATQQFLDGMAATQQFENSFIQQ